MEQRKKNKDAFYERRPFARNWPKARTTPLKKWQPQSGKAFILGMTLSSPSETKIGVFQYVWRYFPPGAIFEVPRTAKSWRTTGGFANASVRTCTARRASLEKTCENGLSIGGWGRRAVGEEDTLRDLRARQRGTDVGEVYDRKRMGQKGSRDRETLARGRQTGRQERQKEEFLLQ